MYAFSKFIVKVKGTEMNLQEKFLLDCANARSKYYKRVAAEPDLELWWRGGVISNIAGGLVFFNFERKP